MRKKQSILGAALLGFLGTIILAGGLIRLTTDDRNESSGGSSESSLPGVSDSSSSVTPVFDPYEGMSGNRTVLTYVVAEDNLTVSGKSLVGAQRAIYSDETGVVGWADFDGLTSFEYTFETPGVKTVEIFDATSFGNRAFYEEKRLKNATFGEGVQTIDSYAFYTCSSLESLTLSNTVTKIGEGAFMYMRNLQEIIIPDNVTALEKQAFMYGYGLKTVTIGAGITDISSQAFAYCTGVTVLTLGENVQTIGERAFSGFQALTELVIPDSVKTIKNSAFSNSDKIVSLTLGEKVQVIESEAFSSFLKLTTITCRGAVPATLSSDAFLGYRKIDTIYVLSETAKTAYQAADGWSAFADKIFVA